MTVALADSVDFVQNLRPEQNRVLIDFFCFTLPVPSTSLACEILEIDHNCFVAVSFGFSGYRSSLRLGNITIFYDGAPDMGVHIVMTGQGCRQYEGGHKRFGDECWQRLIKRIFDAGGKLTRLDLAIDNIDGGLDMARIREAVKNGEFRSKFKSGREISGFTCGRNGKPSTSTGSTIYFGSVSSRLQFRIYDKAAETGCQGDWIRFELQLREKRAQATAALLLRLSAGQVSLGIINQYLSFIKMDSSRSTRCSLVGWWASFIQGVQPLKISIAPAIKHVREAMKHVHKQYSSTIAMIKEYLGTDEFCHYLKNLVDYGAHNMSTRHKAVLAASLQT